MLQEGREGHVMAWGPRTVRGLLGLSASVATRGALSFSGIGGDQIFSFSAAAQER